MNKLFFKKRPLIMGILNLTPDSFSDGGEFNTTKNAIKKFQQLEQDGADIIDIGGESTGPNSEKVALKEELNRVIPILKKIRKITQLPISIDTYKSEVAKQALEEGANMINDVTALRGDKRMIKILSKLKCPVILMYSKDDTARTTIQKKNYKDIMATTKNFLQAQIEFAKDNGIKSENIIIDPGMGNFISQITKYSFEIIARLRELEQLKHPILIGLSRKSFLGGKLSQRDEKGALLEAIAYLNGASIIRTHNVKTTKLCLEWN